MKDTSNYPNSGKQFVDKQLLDPMYILKLQVFSYSNNLLIVDTFYVLHNLGQE